jgi:hypothetical protein
LHLCHQIRFEHVEAVNIQSNSAHTGEEPWWRCSTRSGSNERTVNRHRLRRILYPASSTQPAVCAQWIVRRTMSRGTAPRLREIPAQNLIQQTHAVLVWNVFLNPMAI